MKLFSALLAGLALASLPAAPAAAQDPAPAPCKGFLISDPKGDQAADPVPLIGVPAASAPTEDSTDIQKVFFNMKKGADGKDVLTANIVITNLTKEIPAASLDDGVSWSINYTDANGDAFIAQARNDAGTISYRYQELQNLPGDMVAQYVFVDTTGSFVEGPLGVVSIVLPPTLAKEGTKLTAVFARVSITSKREEQIATSTADRAPDAAADNKSYTVTACPAEASAENPNPPTGEQPPSPTQQNDASTTQPPLQPAPPAQPNQGQQSSQQPAKKKKKKKKAKSCAAKAKKKFKGKKNAKKRKAALKRCKKAKKRKKR